MLKFENHKIRLTGTDQSIRINISNNIGLNGLTDGLNDFIERETGLSINPADDGEITKYRTTTTVNYSFQFYNTGTTTYSTTLANAGFTLDDLNRDNLTKSYYIVQVFDTVKSESQKILHTGFYNGFSFPATLSSVYSLGSDSDMNSYYLKEIELDQVTGNTVYLKFSFFNAKKGKQHLFKNTGSSPTEEIFYFNGTLNRTNKTVSIGNITAKEFINYEYVNEINKNINTVPQQKPTYPTGGTALNVNTYFNPEI